MNDKVTCAIESMKKGYVLDPNRILADYRKETDEIRGLLFLEKLEKLTIEYFREVFVYEKEPSERENSICDIQITTKRNGKIVENDNWSILSREGEFEKQKYGVMVAYKEDMSVMPDVLYSYFKTKVQFPVHALIHATFDLNADRNHLVETEANKHILKVVCDTLVELALLTNSENVNYAPLALLSTIGDFPIDLSWDNFTIKNYYLEAVAVSKVFPTVDNKYISFTEKPRFYDSNIADFLCGNVFSSLMPPTDNTAIRAMLKSIAKHRKVSMRYQYSEITTGINFVLPSLQIRERAALWLVFISEYRNEISSENKPHFILDSSGNTVIDGQQVFLPAENVIVKNQRFYNRRANNSPRER